jgi:hypothetical protein
MFKTRERKILGSILAIALVVLMIDQMSKGPDAVDASVAEETAATVVAASGGVAAAAPEQSNPTPVRVQPVAQLLMEIRARRDADPLHIDNAFAPGEQWPDRTDQQATLDDQTSDPHAFAQAHRATGVMRSQRGGYAIINGNIVRVGQTLNGFTLTEIKQDRVVFRSDRWEVELPLDTSRP